ncbi:MAG: hypothetical protein GXO24_06450 [Chlorobi bacterium]|nr:hypothetical protein [Chlorobiota bacterium]
MKHYLIIWLTLWGLMLQAQNEKPWEAPTRRHFRRMDSIEKARQQALMNDLKLIPVDDSAAYRKALARTLENYADDWDYYFYAELERYKADLGLNNRVRARKESKSERGIVEIIRIMKEMSEEDDKEENDHEKNREENRNKGKPAPSGNTRPQNGTHKKRKKKSSVTTSTRIDWGLNNVDPQPLETSYNTWKSQYISLGMETFVPLDKNGTFKYVVGFGFRWQKLVPNGNYFHSVRNHTMVMVPSSVNLAQNKLRTSWFYGNTGLMIYPARHLSFGVEIYGRIRIGSVQKLKYTMDDARYKLREKRNFYERRLNFGYNVFVGGRHWQVFAGMDRLPYFYFRNERMYQLGITLR